ncbi:Uncharacterized membrane protein [Andreprevotia lacus DSM 23236]|jgi:uncharacterized membrane protein|uniref:Uncharacterized membrane protein n=1 Tax=Andreprevotia lacus DSM 23236 TaxID=1121001 RepID=A0A1W1X4H6_9NEIS|nr:hypothetical protein [Andreprevotia lacus]SMC18618.1 Uncharacterized membrane protein [Andreprevotia lacus DSM 23236]
MSRALSLLAGVLLPLLFWLCHWRGWPFWIAGALLLPLVLVRARSGGVLNARSGRWLALLAALLGAAALLSRSSLPLKLYPVLVNAAMLALFAASLMRGPTIIERLARLSTPELPPAGITYTRKVTLVWCVFFAVNGAIALWTTTQPETVWASYNGLIAYLAMGLLLGGEYLVRLRVMRRDREAGRV